MKTIVKLWIFVAILALLSPLGLVLPELFKAGAAWGEWGTEELPGLVGYIPAGLAKFSSFWSAPIPDYALRGWEGRTMGFSSLSYVISAIAGVAAVICVIFIIGKTANKE